MNNRGDDGHAVRSHGGGHALAADSLPPSRPRILSHPALDAILRQFLLVQHPDARVFVLVFDRVAALLLVLVRVWIIEPCPVISSDSAESA